jgi:hypothetical protein
MGHGVGRSYASALLMTQPKHGVPACVCPHRTVPHQHFMHATVRVTAQLATSPAPHALSLTYPSTACASTSHLPLPSPGALSLPPSGCCRCTVELSPGLKRNSESHARWSAPSATNCASDVYSLQLATTILPVCGPNAHTHTRARGQLHWWATACLTSGMLASTAHSIHCPRC